MSFEYKLWVGPKLYEFLYKEMVRHKDSSVKQTIKRLLLDATTNEQTVANALELVRLRQGVKDGSHPILFER